MILVPILGDQLHPRPPALEGLKPSQVTIVLAEVIEESTHVWSSRMRSAVFIAAMRHYALQLRKQGWNIIYFKLGEHPTLQAAWAAAAQQSKATELRVCEVGDYRVERLLRATASQLKLALRWIDDSHFMISRADFARWAGQSKFLRMEMFYRFMRKKHNVLMQGAEPEGGLWNYDADNRESFGKLGPQDLPEPLNLAPDAITLEVLQDLEKHLPDQPGRGDDFCWPVTREQGLLALEHFIEHKLERFGPTQDAMWKDEPFLFHSLLSVALNLKLIDPREVIQAAVQAYQKGRAPLPSVEGFIRQILGWREFMRGVYWLDMPGLKQANHFNYQRDLPAWYWTGDTQMNCMQQAIGQTLRYGYAHHIQRLMVTGNFALLAGIAPQQVCDWYLAVYVDAIEWVELPNTAGMALYANGGRFTTKPYVASGAYIKRMSNYCQGCRYDPSKRVGKNACPMTTLYWDFLERHQDELNRNPRAALMMKNHARLSASERQEIRQAARAMLERLDSL